ncbi:glutathione S-transferase C-terminal domain-containing protein [Aeromicrobium halocynthiae]|uniref:Glutathione S-transferase C-terminal domain-containing protein n=1 Tax=Aeromicrobium halocynthiae TaxID=560557 RepID=A0ABN2W709_9ACTN
MAPSRFTARITADEGATWSVAAGRYRMLVSRACPFASRALIVRRLLGLEVALTVAIVDPIQDELGWRFTLDEGGRDPVLGIRYVRDAYLAADPGHASGFPVPAVVDVESGHVVTNDFATIPIDLATQWRSLHRPGAPDLYPDGRREEIDEFNAILHRDVVSGVYEVGMARSQADYDRAFTALFSRLEQLDARLASRRFLLGDRITDVDVHLFPSLVRFDLVYHGHFRCNRVKLVELPHLWGYARDLFQTPGFGDTVDFDHINRHYHLVLDESNPHHLLPGGPDRTLWLTAHGREELGGAPFGDGTPPGPPREPVPPAGRADA